MGVIHLLDTEISNKIAAGEVVERPASIVKELVENSIDAGATRITVEIRDGGISYIRITDNGCGMGEEDAKICFLRHATSKIQTGEDLEAIYTLGFRGEALSSIGAVTKVKLYTKRAADETGICVSCEGGEILSSKEQGVPDGTVVEVHDVFYNTPARRKFLKKAATEAGYIQDIISRYVFAHPEISFKYIRDGKEIIFSSGDNKLLNAVYSIYGKDYARNMLEVDYEYNGIVISGVVGKGTLARANRTYQTFLVNRRYVKNASMMKAVEEAYKNQIMISKFPTVILNIDINAEEVDINVHPTKLECKFSNESDIYKAVYHAVKTTLYALPNVPEIERTQEQPSNFQPQGGEQKSLEELFRDKVRQSNAQAPKFTATHRETPRDLTAVHDTREKTVAERKESVPAMASTAESGMGASMENAYNRYMNKAREAQEQSDKSVRIVEEQPRNSKQNEEQSVDTFAMLDYALERSKKKTYDKLIVNEATEEFEPIDEEVEIEKFRDEANERYRIEHQNSEQSLYEGDFRVIGQLFNTYILIEKDDRMLMIDQHAAHERLNYEALKEELSNSGVTSQILMEPAQIRLSGYEFSIYEMYKAEFSELGFECGDNGVDTVEVSSAPCDLSFSDVEPLFLELLSQAYSNRSELIGDRKQRLLYTISCKAAVKANMAMSMLEMEVLVKKVFALKNINTCPHGRPIVISMSKNEIEKEFKRIT